MKEALRPRYSVPEYLEIEELSPNLRHEYVAGEVYAMAGGSVEHSALASTLIGILHTHLSGRPCRPHGSDLRIWIDRAEVSTYADVVVLCDPVETAEASPTQVTNPQIIIEVLSSSTERYDREQKRLYYQQLESLREYVLVAQERQLIEVYTRRDDETWSHASYARGARAHLDSIGLDLDVSDLYAQAGITLGD